MELLSSNVPTKFAARELHLNSGKHIICDRYRHLDKTVRFGATLISFLTINAGTYVLV